LIDATRVNRPKATQYPGWFGRLVHFRNL